MNIFKRTRTKIETTELHVPLADVHCHMLPGLDDGAADVEMSMALLQEAYREGIRTMICTPHVRDPWLDVTVEQVDAVFEGMRQAAAGVYPDLELFLGSEVYLTGGIFEEGRDRFRRMNQTDYLLVEFSPTVHFSEMQYCISRLLNEGYLPVIAHVERYGCLWKEQEHLWRLKDMGAYLQMNAHTMTGTGDKRQKKILDRMLLDEVIDFAATDAHDVKVRPPKMQEAYRYVHGLCGETYATRIFWENARKMIDGDML
jgi:protein-tyrosine phosphatase